MLAWLLVEPSPRSAGRSRDRSGTQPSMGSALQHRPIQRATRRRRPSALTCRFSPAGTPRMNSRSPLTVALIQERNHGDAAANLAVIEARVAEAAAQGAKLVLLQELHNGPYFCQHESVDEFDLAEPIPGPSTERLRSEEHTSELQSQSNLVCRLLLEKKKKKYRVREGNTSRTWSEMRR